MFENDNQTAKCMLNRTIIKQAWVIDYLEYVLSHHGTDMEIK
jgi:hypothetical protein